MAPHQTDGLPPREPFEVSFLCFLVSYGVLSTFGLLPAPPSIQAATHATGDYWWTLLIGLGSLIALLGLFFPRKPLKIRTTPIILEQVGLAFVGSASFFYGVALIANNGWEVSFYSATLEFAFTFASGWQFWRLQKLLNKLYVLNQRCQEE